MKFHEILVRNVLIATPTGKLPKRSSKPRARWSDHISNLAWSRLRVEPAELSETTALVTVRYFEFF